VNSTQQNLQQYKIYNLFHPTHHAHPAHLKIREGSLTWEDLDQNDIDIRLKWVGMLHRRKKNPGKFMMRLKVPNGILNSEQMRFFADCVSQYDEDVGVIDITTRQNIQMR